MVAEQPAFVSLDNMITSRRLQAEDYDLLASSLAKDEYHITTDPMFFVEPDTITLVYEDKTGPVMFVRGKGIAREDGTNTLQLDIQFCNNYDGRRNIRTMLEGFPPLIEKARANHFVEVQFDSSAPLLRKFCVERLGFIESTGQTLRYVV